ncbi:hypothetical protein CH35J_004841 [Colletotrichum higginsianum]|uniref:Uncharacterized protein n=1 Tax=Colletotrichum higginsianum TaxID=80884 RepID=A0A4T0WA71_9PEZI|nr:hypothetical protein CH35J_004841 [Colletotrichum higginsianum]
MRPDIRIYSDFCVDHTCKYCVLGLEMCNRPKELQDRFCSEHRRCGVTGCDRTGDCPSGVPLPWKCPDHKCYVDNCYKTREKLYGYCLDHRCRVASCFERRTVDSEYCVDHVSRICRELKCREPVHADNRCLLHQICTVKDCKGFRLGISDGGHRDFCDKHYTENRLRDRDYNHSPLNLNHHVHHPHFGDLQIRHDKLTRDYDECVNRLNASRDEIRILRTTWVSADDNRIWRKEIEDRNARLLLDLDREQKRTEHWERKAVELGRRIDDLEVLLAEERLRHPKSDEYVRQIADLVRKVEILEEELRIERLSHHAHEGRQHEIDRLRRTIEELERKLKGDHIKVDQLQSIIAGEREQKDILLEEIAKRDEFERQRREDRRRPRRGSWERRSRDSRPWGSVF